MPRRFTLGEAQNLLPRLTRLLGDLSVLKGEYGEAESAIRSAAERIMLTGGANVDRERARQNKARLESAAVRLRSSIAEFESLGCVLRDLESGLVDFPTSFRGEDVFLCWKQGEPEIAFWHAATEGFAGRKPIDQDFRENHRGDPPQ